LIDYTGTCAESIFDFEHRRIQFVLTADPKCDLQIHMTASVQVKLKFDLNYDDFFKNDNKTTLTNTIATFLGIPPNRIRIVNIRPGSV